MSNIKDKFEFIIGYSAIIISLSAFKTELSAIKIDLSFWNFSLSEYFIVLIVGFVMVLYLYSISYFFSTMGIFRLHINIFKHLENFSYYLFGFIIATPIILVLIMLFKFVITRIQSLPSNVIDYSMPIVSALVSMLFGYFSSKVVNKFKIAQAVEEKNKIEEEDLKIFEITQKMIQDGYYGQSIIESFKLLENNLYKILKLNKLAIRKSSFQDMLYVSRQYNLIDDEKLKRINEIKILRNEIVHLNKTEIFQKEAQLVLDYIKELILNIPEYIPNQELESEEKNKYFQGKVFTDINEAMYASQKQKKPLLIVIYDGNLPTKSKLDYSLGYFTEYDTTKKIINNNFIQALINKQTNNVEELIPLDDPLENCLLVIIDKTGKRRFSEGVYANPDEGLNRTRKFIQELEK